MGCCHMKPKLKPTQSCIKIPVQYYITCDCKDFQICNCDTCNNPNCDCFNLRKCLRCRRIMMKEEFIEFFGYCEYCRSHM